MDCCAALAMTVKSSTPSQLVIHGIIGITGLAAAIEGGAVVGRQRKSFSETARQVRLGNEDAAERDGVGMTGGNRRFRGLAGKTAGRVHHPPPSLPEQDHRSRRGLMINL